VKVYRVGGSVRDELAGRPVADRDWVVVGSTPEELVRQGFRPVGRDFPVFLHPQTHEEYALARTERKRGRGYRGFAVCATPEVTLEEDLMRRDLTINAMARDELGALIDPFGGERDLAAGVLRHVSPAFAEDPLRVLRVARFAARYGFEVAPETAALMRVLSASGELATLSPERVWQELARGLMEPHPSRLLAVLRECGALRALLPEIDALFGVPRVIGSGVPFDAGATVARSLDVAAARAEPLPVRFALLVHDLGPAVAPPEEWPVHGTHAATGVRLAARVSSRLRAPSDCRDSARLAAGWAATVDAAADLAPAKLLALLARSDALRRPERLDALLAVCGCRAAADPDSFAEGYPPAAVIREALEVVRGVKVSTVASLASREGGDIARAIRGARLEALREWKRARRGDRSGRPAQTR
jgi:tRNA nucleotidyltransferase (CCA-adding enzyme)